MNRPGALKEIDLKNFLPSYIADEELSDLVQLFSNVLNSLYDGETNYYSNEEVEISEDEHLAQEDNSEVLWKFGNGTVDSIVAPGRWPYYQRQYGNYPSSLELENTRSTDYLGVYPQAGSNVPFPIQAQEDNNNNLNRYPFDYSKPLMVSATPSNILDEFGAPISVNLRYDKIGLFEIKDIYLNKKLKNYAKPNSFYASINRKEMKKEAVGILEKIYKLLDLRDPGNVDFKFIHNLADHLGYDMNLNMINFENSSIVKENVIKKFGREQYSEDIANIKTYMFNDSEINNFNTPKTWRLVARDLESGSTISKDILVTFKK